MSTDTWCRISSLEPCLGTGAGGQYVFDFSDLGWEARETYTLIEFGSANFNESGFSYSNRGSFAGDFIVEGNRL